MSSLRDNGSTNISYHLKWDLRLIKPTCIDDEYELQELMKMLIPTEGVDYDSEAGIIPGCLKVLQDITQVGYQVDR